jgi:TPR repeat protein
MNYIAMTPEAKHFSNPREQKYFSLEEARKLYETGCYSEAQRQFRHLAEKGNPEAGYYLALLALDWKNDRAAAIKLLEKTVKQRLKSVKH